MAHRANGTGLQERPGNLGDYALRSYVAECSSSGLPWWNVCITSALLDLSRRDGFIEAFCGIAQQLRHGAAADWVVGGDSVKAAFDVTYEWLDAGIEPAEVGPWLQAGCWNPTVARQLVDAGIRPVRLLNQDGVPAHWLAVGDGNKVPLATAVVEWQFPIPEAVRIVTGMAPYQVTVPKP